MAGFSGTYDPQLVTVSFGGKPIPGPFGASDIIKVSRNTDLFTLAIGADGRGARTKNADRSGKIEITVGQASLANAILSAIAAVDELAGTGVGPFLVKDNSDLGTMAEAENAWITKPADIGRGKELGEVTWTLETDSLKILHAGLPLATP